MLCEFCKKKETEYICDSFGCDNAVCDDCVYWDIDDRNPLGDSMIVCLTCAEKRKSKIGVDLK